MKKIYSKIEPDVLLHIAFTKEEIAEQRVDISPENEFLQLSAFKIHNGKTYRPHKHIYCERLTTITQELWIVIAGSVQVIYYDLDDSIVDTVILNAGDVTITFRGGHTYECMQDNSLIYEIKQGPYLGQTADKVFI